VSDHPLGKEMLDLIEGPKDKTESLW